MKYIHTTTYSTEIEMNNPELHVSNWEKKKKKQAAGGEYSRVSFIEDLKRAKPPYTLSVDA